MHIIGSIVLACQSQKQLMLWAFMPASRKPLALRPKSARSYFLAFINHDRIFIYVLPQFSCLGLD